MTVSKFVRTTILAIGGAIWLIPVYLLIANASKDGATFSAQTLWTIGSFGGLWQNIFSVFTTTDVAHGLWASFLYAAVAPLISVTIGALAGYGVVVLRLRHGFTWFFLIFAGTIFPIQMMVIPWFDVYARTDLFDSALGMIIIYSAIGIPFAAFVMRNFFMGVSRSMIEAATVDGAGVLRTFVSIYIPMSWSALGVVYVLSATSVWNDLLISLILTQSSARPIMPLLVALQAGGEGGGGIVSYTAILAAALIASIPTVVLFLVSQRLFKTGLTLGQYS